MKEYLWKQTKELAWVLFLAVSIKTFVFGHYRVPSGSMETTMLVGENYFADKLSYYFRTPRHGEIISFNQPDFKYSDNAAVKTFQMYLWGPMNWTKRVIGVPGDHVRGDIEDGRPVIYRNGQKLDEQYTNKYPLVPADNHPAGLNAGLWSSADLDKPYSNQPFYYNIDPDKVAFNQLQLQRAGWQPVLYPQTPLPGYCSGSDVFDVKLGEKQYWVMGDNRLGSDDCRRWGPLDEKLIHGRIVFRAFSADPVESWFLLDILLHPIDFWSRVRWNRCLQLV